MKVIRMFFVVFACSLMLHALTACVAERRSRTTADQHSKIALSQIVDATPVSHTAVVSHNVIPDLE